MITPKMKNSATRVQISLVYTPRKPTDPYQSQLMYTPTNELARISRTMMMPTVISAIRALRDNAKDGMGGRMATGNSLSSRDFRQWCEDRSPAVRANVRVAPEVPTDISNAGRTVRP